VSALPLWVSRDDGLRALHRPPINTPTHLRPSPLPKQPPTDIDWWRTGVIPPAGTYSNYWTDPYTLFTIEVVAMQFAELKRLQDFRYPGSQGKQYFLGLEKVFEGSGNPAYPGGPWFNMFNLGKTEAEMKTLKLKEIKNGRLAMIAMLGYGAQAVMTQKGPFANLCDHLADPTGTNILTNFGKVLSGQ
jgi:light-harvesting complex I chlorophyll a/b binding protein 3